MMVDHHLAAGGALDKWSQLVLARRDIEITAYDQVGLLHHLAAEGVVTGVNGYFLETGQELQIARRLVWNDHRRLLS